MIFSIFAIIDGIGILVFAALDRGRESKLMQLVPWSWKVLIPLAIIEIVVGVLILLWPAATLGIIVFFIALWALILGMAQIFSAIGNRRGGSRALGIITGVVAFALGVFLLIYPVGTLVFFFWLLGFYLVIFGGFAISVAVWGRRDESKGKLVPGQG
jgi:uncharacterized membrane protein HdeD (DUF308 family)